MDGDALGAYRAFRHVRFFSCLDGLRAISILAVIWHHTGNAIAPDGIPFLHRGNRGVMLFFVISAFLISTLLLRAKENGRIDVPRFWARRALRIMPLFYVVLTVYVVLVACFEPNGVARQAFFQNLPAFATFTSNWFVELDNPRVIFYFAWSLAAEEQFYLCWPWVERYFSRLGAIILATVALVGTQLAATFLLPRYGDVLVLRILASVPAAILCGVILAHVLNAPRSFAAVWSFAGRRESAIIAVVVAIAALNLDLALGVYGELLTAIAFTFLVATCVVREDNALARLLRIRAVAWVGTVSYGIYLVHMLSVGAVRRVLADVGVASPLWDFIGGALVSIAIASLSYLTFERFFLQLKDRWFSATPTRRAAEIHTTALDAAVPARATAQG
jgi:peptidoglycan/LPS O-acetylase OafA/YrhL